MILISVCNTKVEKNHSLSTRAIKRHKRPDFALERQLPFCQRLCIQLLGIAVAGIGGIVDEDIHSAQCLGCTRDDICASTDIKHIEH